MAHLKLLFLSFYNLDYGIGASASFIDQLVDLPSYTIATIIEPNRIDLPKVKVDLPTTVKRFKAPIPFKGLFSFLYPFFAFFYGLKIALKLKPNIIFSMHHPFHTLSLVGHILSKILHIPHVIDLRDVWRPMGLKLTIFDRLEDALERKIAKLVKNDLMIFVCKENKKILESRTKITFNNTLILPNCVSYSTVKDIAIKQIGKKQKKFIQFIFVGRVSPEYGLEKLQPLFNTLKLLGYKTKFLIIGHCPKKSIPKYAIYLGNLSRKKALQLIAESDVGIGPMNPTLAIPRKVVEYLILGKVVIVGKNAISSYILKKYKDYIVEVSEKDDIRKAALKILKTLNGERKRSATKRMYELYCKERIKAILNKVFSRNIPYQKQINIPLPLTVCIASAWYPNSDNLYNGIFVHEFAKRLLRNGFKVFVVTSSFGKKDEDASNLDGVIVFRIKFKNLFKILKLFFYADLIHIHAVNLTGAIFTIFAKLLSKPVIITVHRADALPTRNLFYHILRFIALNFAEVITPVSVAVRRLILKRGASTKKIEVIYNTVDEFIFRPRDKYAARRYLNLDLESKIILFVGNLVKRKGVAYLIKAMMSVCRNFQNSLLIIIGDGPERRTLKTIVTKANLNNKILFLGSLSSRLLPFYYNAADVFVLPSLHEGHSMVLLEAMASGLPIIATKVGGNTETVINGVNGFLVKPANTEEISEKLLRILSDETLAQKFGKNGRKIYIKFFSEEKQLLKLKNIYLKILNKKNKNN